MLVYWCFFPSLMSNFPLLFHPFETPGGKKNIVCLLCALLQFCRTMFTWHNNKNNSLSFVRTWWQRSENDFVEKSWRKCVSPGGLTILTKSWQILWHMLKRKKKNIGPRGELWGTPCNQWSGDLVSLIKSVMVVWQFKWVHGSHTLQTKRASVMPVGVIQF